MFNEPHYEMNARKRGTFVIFCYSEVKKTKTSKLPFVKPKYKQDDDVYKDLVYLERLALSMGFLHEDIVLFDNLTELETQQALIILSEYEHKYGQDHDCFVCAILSHGNVDGWISTKDSFINIGDFMDNFCTALAGKPKIFIKVTCMGKKDMAEEKIKAENLEAREMTYSLMGNSSLSRSKSLKKKSYNGGEKMFRSMLDFSEEEDCLKKSFEQDRNSDVTIKKSLEEDFLLFNSTVEGFCSYVQQFEEYGSGVIYVLCKLFADHGLKKDFVQVLTDAMYFVGHHTVEYFGKETYYRNMPSFESRLTKKLFFNKKTAQDEDEVEHDKSKLWHKVVARRLRMITEEELSMTEVVGRLEKKFYVAQEGKPLSRFLSDGPRCPLARGFPLRRRINLLNT